MRSPLLAGLLVLALATDVRAAPVPSYIEDTTGEWLVATDDGKPGCRVVLSPDRTIGGWRAVPAADCAARLPKVAQATAWDFDGGVRLFNADRKLLLEFGEDETTIMKTSFEMPPVHFMVKA